LPVAVLTTTTNIFPSFSSKVTSSYENKSIGEWNNADTVCQVPYGMTSPIKHAPYTVGQKLKKGAFNRVQLSKI